MILIFQSRSILLSALSLLRSVVPAVTSGFLACIGIIPCHAQLPEGWSGVEISTPTVGSDAYSSGSYTIAGSGMGLHPEGDHLHFIYTTLKEGGNFRLTAHVARFNGGIGSEVGLIVRQGTSMADSMGAVAYQPLAGNGNSPNAFAVFARNNQAAAIYPWRNFGLNSAMAPPCWLQIVRYGNNFAVYKSSDGKFWAQVHDASGGPFSVSGPIQVGFSVSSGGTDLATATIDNVKLEMDPTLPYESSWIGNTFSSDAEGYVSGDISAMWVAPDGTCYTTGFWDEGGELGKIYKDGKIVKGFSLPANHAFEGAITSDGTHLYYLGQFGSTAEIFQTDMEGNIDHDVTSIYFQAPIFDAKALTSHVTGLACGNGELYVSDQLTGQILVADLSRSNFGIVPYAVIKSTTHPIDKSLVTDPAPDSIYQTAIQADIVQLNIPGLNPGHSYNVRLHFAELNPDDAGVGKRIMDLQAGDKTLPAYDIYAAAGAINKATAVSFTGVVPDQGGKLSVTAVRSKGTIDGTATLSGVEILNSDGTLFKQINCGGPDAESWQGTIQEIPSRAFAFTRPGPIAVDKNGNLWIVQEGTTFPASANFTSTPGWAAIKLYDKNGHYLNKQITDVVSPTALSYDRLNDRLIVAENGPAQNIRIYSLYSGTAQAVACTSTFGVEGGVFAGKSPGVIHDPSSGGDARFFGPTGVGQDSKGDIYVACNPGLGANQTCLRAFDPVGKLLWSLFGLEMTHTGDFDPTRKNSDVWTTIHHYSMEYSGSKPGSEWKLKSFIANPFKYAFPPNAGGGCAVYRKVGSLHAPILYTAGQGIMGPLYIYRFEGEQIIPCGSIGDVERDGNGGLAIWSDTNGDGIQQNDEVSYLVPSGGTTSFDVDNNGNIYFAMTEIGGDRPKVVEFPLQGFNSHGVPIYSTKHRSFMTPAEFNDPNTGNVRRLRYVGGELDTMYLLGATRPNANQTDYNFGGTLGCYDHWSTTPVKRFVTVLPTPADNPNFLGSAPPYAGDGFLYMAFDVANGVSFVSDLWGTMRVVDARGNLMMNMIPGPEVSGGNAWEDEAMGVRAHYNADTGEYDILQENSGFRAKENFYRWFGPRGSKPEAGHD